MPVEPNMYDDEALAKMRAEQTDPWVMYLIIRKSLKMSRGKIGSQCGHAAQMVVIKYYQSVLDRAIEQLSNAKEFEAHPSDKSMIEWMHESFRKSVLVASDNEWEKLKVEEGLRCFVVRDAGLTEVDPGSETVMALWPIRKSQAPKILKRLQTLKDPPAPFFEEEWAKKEKDGYRYGHDALEQVKFGWEMYEDAIKNR